MSKLIIENVRGSYVYVTEKNKDGKFSMQLIIPKNHPQIPAIKKAIVEKIAGKFGADAAKKPARFKLPLRDGDAERDEPEYEGCYFMNANNGRAPGIVNRMGRTPNQEDFENFCYSGASFNVSVSFFTFDVPENKGVGVGLNNLMFVAGGDRLDGSTSAENDFAGMAGESEETSSGFDDFDDDDIPF